jgi:hypothetical protein
VHRAQILWFVTVGSADSDKLCDEKRLAFLRSAACLLSTNTSPRAWLLYLSELDSTEGVRNQTLNFEGRSDRKGQTHDLEFHPFLVSKLLVPFVGIELLGQGHNSEH